VEPQLRQEGEERGGEMRLGRHLFWNLRTNPLGRGSVL
jgi:hypothetical protein